MDEEDEEEVERVEISFHNDAEEASVQQSASKKRKVRPLAHICRKLTNRMSGL